jgi:type IV pilus assembly protein PilA
MKNVKSVKKNNKGFSLVELIVVIAIMAVLVGVLAPQFMGYVTKSKKSTDVKNGQEIASAISVAMADDSITISATGGAATKEQVVDGSGIGKDIKTANLLASIPTVKSMTSGYYWATYDASTGNVEIYIGTAADSATMIYPTNSYN